MLSQISKTALIGLFTLFFTGFSNHTTSVLVKAKTTYVYICITKNSYAYHYDYNCRGLKQCKGEKRKVTLEEAKLKYKRKLCGWED